MAHPGVVPYVYPLIHPVTYFDLSRELMDHASTIQWCQTMKLVSASKLCSCGRECAWRTDTIILREWVGDVQYEERVREIEHGSFSPLVFSTAGGMGPIATTVYKRIA